MRKGLFVPSLVLLTIVLPFTTGFVVQPRGGKRVIVNDVFGVGFSSLRFQQPQLTSRRLLSSRSSRSSRSSSPSSTTTSLALTTLPSLEVFSTSSSIVLSDIMDIAAFIAYGIVGFFGFVFFLGFLTTTWLIPAAAKQLEENCQRDFPELWVEFQSRMQPGETLEQRPDLIQELGTIYNDRLLQIMDQQIIQQEPAGSSQDTTKSTSSMTSGGSKNEVIDVEVQRTQEDA